MAALLRRLLAAYDDIPYFLVATLTRVALGLVFHQSWRTKIDFSTWSIKPSVFFLFAQEYKVPLLPPVVATYLATSAELLCPLLLWAGLATRFAATALLIMVLVIQLFVYPQAFQDHALWAAGLLMLMRFGPGILSLDHAIARRRNRA